LEKLFKNVAEKETDLNRIYDYILKDVKLYRQVPGFEDDLSIILLKRIEENDIFMAEKDDKFTQKLKSKD
jgi:hypothetical protein